MINIHRYTSINLPSNRYIPGQGKHPNKLSAQNHFPELPEPPIWFSSQTWKQSEIYLYAIDLFNYGYYWEVHEVLEKIWLKIGKTSPEGIFIQGIIQLSVALLKKTQSNTLGCKRMTEKALPKLHTQQRVYLGIEIAGLVDQFKAFTETVEGFPPVIILEF